MSLWTHHAHHLKGVYGVLGNEHPVALNTITAVERGARLRLSKRAQTEWVFAPDNAHKCYWLQAKVGSPTINKPPPSKRADAK